MKSFAPILAVLAATVAAQSPEDILNKMPKCALACIQSAAAAQGCATGDFACECKNMETVTAEATKCQLGLDADKKCSGSELATALKVGAELCAAVAAGGGSDDSTDSATPTATDAKPTESGDATATATDGEATTATDSASTTSSDGDADATPTESGAPDASGGSDSGSDGEGSGDSAGGDGNAGNKLGGFAWAGVAAAAVAYVF
ncbi:uncharacterized protein DNG_09416 [Cephalotrichum gorgonifer]|uniref:CFEM domain-containing protein n=1 Tax=Cephalotrichum gorgonifer TaxID=2041049 RepID=A0AAE8T033_9PEZI|nr:uncharacterized protein DNG_09416 [Cephalotrichum gorgonifer]